MATQKLPNIPIAKDYLDLLNADSASLLESDEQSRAHPELFERWKTVRDQIKAGLEQDGDISLVCVFELEALQIRLLPDSRILSKAWIVRATYLSIVSKELMQKYVETNPPDLRNKTPTPEEMKRIRADVEDLVSGLQWWYVSAFRKDSSLRSLKSVLLLAALIGLGLCIGATMLLAWQAGDFGRFLRVMSPIETIFYVLYAGFLGAVTSTIRRIQPVAEESIAVSDPLIKTIAIEQGHLGVYLSITLGAIFALVLYLALGSGVNLALGPSAPRFAAGTPGSPCTNCAIFCFFTGLLPASSTEFAKLLVWSFVAGFSERLVPDMLDRFQGNKKGR